MKVIVIIILSVILQACTCSANHHEQAVDSDHHPNDTVLPVIPDDSLLTLVQQRTFRYFWDYAHPVSGLARERLGSGDIVTSGGSGFGVMTLPVAVERGFISREDGASRLLKIVTFLNSKADRFHGAYSHWLNGAPVGTSGLTADDAVNLIRHRAQLPLLSAVTMQEVWDERRAELALEEDRFFDLIRTGQAATVLGPKGFTSGKNELLPIPANQRQLNPNLAQNPGY